MLKPVGIVHKSAMQHNDSLVHLPVENWPSLQKTFVSDWPRGISGFTVLETQRKWLESGFNYGFQVFCPYGDVENGMVAINKKHNFYEIIIQCLKDDTRKLEDAIVNTKLIDWRHKIIVPFAPKHIIECLKNIVKRVNVEIELILPSESFILDKQSPLFVISLPPGITFGLLTLENVDLVNSNWPHRYPGSEWYFQLLIKTKSGFGLFNNQNLIAWVFLNEAGPLGHLYTLEEHRRKGYGELLLRLISNKLLEEGKDVIAFAVKGNEKACQLYKKVGFKDLFKGVAWCYLKNCE